jgi:drug/metabolite transporter (DMT)-like permease
VPTITWEVRTPPDVTLDVIARDPSGDHCVVTVHSMSSPPDTSILGYRVSATAAGTLCMLLTVFIWGMQPVVLRLAAHQGLTPADMTVFRFGIASLFLIPIALRHVRFPVGALGWKRALVLTVLGGAPYNYFIIVGAAYAPALDGASILTAVALLMTVVLARALSGERITPVRLVALTLVCAGLLPFAVQSVLQGIAAGNDTWRGHAMFACAACMWGTVAPLSKRWNVDPWNFTSAIVILSAATIPLWIVALPTHWRQVDPAVVGLHALFFGLIQGVLSIVLFQKAIGLLGATTTGMFFALVPFTAWIGGQLVLGERPSVAEIAGMLLVVAGLAIAPFGARPPAQAEPR